MINPLRIEGKEFYRGADLFVPRLTSGLTLLTKTRDEMVLFLDDAKATGYNGVRVFCGALVWNGSVVQTPEGARGAATTLLNLIAERDLIAEMTLLTDTGTGYDAEAHLTAFRDILRPYKGRVLTELMNEVGHHTQDPIIDRERLMRWGRELFLPHGLLWAVGAPVSTDEPTPDGYFAGSGGDYITAHLSRGRDPWNMVRRVRELYAIVESYGVPVLNNEPIGADEFNNPGKRLASPVIFYAMGALERAFPGVGGVHHSTAGLEAVLPGPIQRACAHAYIKAHGDVARILPQRGNYKNVGHDGSPYHGVPVGEQDGAARVRLYAFVRGDRGVAIDVGRQVSAGSAPLAGGWKETGVSTGSGAHDGRVCVVLGLTTGAVGPPPVPPPAGDPLLDALLTPAYPVGYDFFVRNFSQIQAEARLWYLRAFQREPADSDVAHGLWRALNEGERWKTLRGAFEEAWPGGGKDV